MRHLVLLTLVAAAAWSGDAGPTNPVPLTITGSIGKSAQGTHPGATEWLPGSQPLLSADASQIAAAGISRRPADGAFIAFATLGAKAYNPKTRIPLKGFAPDAMLKLEGRWNGGWLIGETAESDAADAYRMKWSTTQLFTQGPDRKTQASSPSKPKATPIATRFWRIGDDSTRSPVGDPLGDHLCPIPSPDGSLLACVVVRERRWHIGIIDGDGGERRVATSSARVKEGNPLYGTLAWRSGRIIFASRDGSSRWALMEVGVDGGRSTPVQKDSRASLHSPTCSPDGRLLAWIRSAKADPGPGDELWLQEGDGEPRRLLAPDRGEGLLEPCFTANGTLLVRAEGKAPPPKKGDFCMPSPPCRLLRVNLDGSTVEMAQNLEKASDVELNP